MTDRVVELALIGAGRMGRMHLRALDPDAGMLGIDRVVTMAGCPGGRTGGPIGVFGLWATSNDDEGLWSWQMEAEVGPCWRALSDWAAATAPDVRICLELHPGVSVYSVETYRALRTYAGANVWVNLDPSHFWWQGADPIRVVCELAGVIGWAHGKDTTIYLERVALRGVLDPTFPPDPASSSWHFSAVGDGHDLPTWRSLVRALQDAGHDGVISIEHEDPALSPQECIARSAIVLRDAVAA